MRRFVAITLGVAVMTAVGGLTSFLGSASASSATAARAQAARSGKITFSTPTIVDPIHTFGEPSIDYNTPRNEFFASGPTGTGTQRSVWYGSVDQGHTFRAITPGPVPNAVQTFNNPPGGGDTTLAFDRSGNEYFADLYALACLRSAVTRDGGASSSQGFDACGQNPGADRQWLAVYDPPPNIPHLSAYKGQKLIYMEYNNLTGPGPNGGAEWQMSTDGTSWSNADSGVNLLNETQYSPFGPDGFPAIDQETGKVFQAAGFPEGYPNQPSNPKWDLLLNIGTPDSSGQLTFLDHPTSSSGGGPNYSGLIPIVKGLKDSPDTLFSVLSMDSARNLYVVYMENDSSNPKLDQAFVSASSASSGWRSWTKPVQVSNGSTKTGDAVNIMPWIKAGGPGRADAVWYGQDKASDPSGQSGQKWNVFMSQLVFPVNSQGQITGAAPRKRLVKVSPHPMHYGGICLLGTGCITAQGNRNVADFFSVTIDKQGAAQVIYDDTSNGLIQPGTTFTGQQADHSGAPLVTIAKQSSGMGLYGKPVHAASNAPVGGLNDPAGDAQYPLFGGKNANLAGMDIRRSALALSSDGKTLTVTMKVSNLNALSAAMSTIPGSNFLQYVTRWQMGNTLYFAAMSTSGGSPSYYAGTTGSIDLCSVSACFPHVLIYPESGIPSVGGGTSSTEPGTATCPKNPSASNPCTITIRVATADVGKPNSSSLLGEVGGYALSTSHPQALTTTGQAQADNVPLEIDGVCCFNYKAAALVVHKHHHHHHRHHKHHHRVHRHHHKASHKPRNRHRRGFTG